MATQEIQKINLVNSDINNELINSKNLTNFRPSVIDKSREEELMMNLISMKKLKFYLDGLDQLFEVGPIVIEGLNHAINLGL